MHTIKNRKIAIVGGGPGGLTLARLLQLKGADATIYERDAHAGARPQGATLDLHEESGLAALKEAGLMDAFWKNHRPGADRMRITDEQANIAYDEHATEGRGAFRPEIDRGPLLQLLMESLQPGTIVWDHQFAAMIPKGEGWDISFKNGATTYADLVIAADGANSRIRPYLTPIRPVYSGITVVEGSVYDAATNSPQMHELLQGGKVFALGNSRSLILSAKGDGSLVFYTGHRADENWSRDGGVDFADREQVLAWFRKEFKGWSAEWESLFRNAALPFVPRPQYCTPPHQSWEAQPNLTLIGDAAHLMPPYAGEGVNMAMLDALELARQLTSETHPDSRAAIAAYETEMRARASETATMTLQATEALHGPGAIRFLLDVIGE